MILTVRNNITRLAYIIQQILFLLSYVAISTVLILRNADITTDLAIVHVRVFHVCQSVQLNTTL